jgi:hypothetical protein
MLRWFRFRMKNPTHTLFLDIGHLGGIVRG